MPTVLTGSTDDLAWSSGSGCGLAVHCHPSRVSEDLSLLHRQSWNHVWMMGGILKGQESSKELKELGPHNPDGRISMPNL